MKNKPAKWSTLRTHIQKQGGRSDGLYNKPKRSKLTDSPQVSPTKLEMLIDYIEQYRNKNGSMPSYTHLNSEFNMRATKEYYWSLITK
ncbi:hypothetical protein LH23_14265 [Cedecea neteri]|uniref:Uncharacterized protein n=1 Tax=Cedecea neteri TaxID=158822 RepID=A0AAN0S5T3_9ENTR|nr:hypothetical protein LH23_14265 [Cedecea neteri]